MRTGLVILTALASLTFASASWASPRLTIVGAEAPIHTVASQQKKQNQSKPLGKLKARGGNAASTHPSGCVHGNDNVDRCTKICIASASGDMCADQNSCFRNGQPVSCAN